MDNLKKRDNPFTDYNHMEIARAEQDYAEVYLDVTREATNVYHVVHGGALFTMADYCAGVTACSNGRRYVTQEPRCSLSETPAQAALPPAAR